ncbi:MAG TPA: hypothetical protein PK826_01110 [Anaerolineae bacterium]|nr:hypothetical protein [Ardenticatenia bacterium]HQZ69909.1 hypothetical protein [Anaerolineae bacterium]
MRRRPRAGLLPLAAMLLGWQPAFGVAMAAPAQGGLEVTAYTPSRLELGGNVYILVRGMLRNGGSFGLGQVTVDLMLWGADPAVPLGHGIGQAFLERLAPGEESPFSVAVRHCCPDDARRYAFTLSGPEQRERPYRSLEVRAVSSRQGTRGPERTGELFNAGNLSVNAPSLDLYAAYWRGSDLIDLRTANLPVLWSLGGPVGQALPPGLAYPFAVAEPAEPFDRVAYFINGSPYPVGLYPVPLGLGGLDGRPDGTDLVWRGLLTNCGLAAVDGAIIILDWREDGKVRGFARWDLDLGSALPPGGGRWVSLRLSDGPPALLEPGAATFLPLALAVQEQPPPAYVCAIAPQRLSLPLLGFPQESLP